MDKFFASFGAMVLLLLLGFCLSAIPACLWFCFDDTLADVLGNPKIGNVGFWTVFAFCYFLSCVFKASVSYTNKSKQP